MMRLFPLLVLVSLVATSSPARADRYAYVLDRGAGLVSALNIDRGKVTAQIGLIAPAGAALSGDGRTLFVAESSHETIAVVSVPAMTLIKRVGVGGVPSGVALDSLYERVFVAHEFDGVAAFSAYGPYPDDFEDIIPMGTGGLAGGTAAVNQLWYDEVFVAYQNGGLGTISPTRLTGSVNPTGGLPYATDIVSYDDPQIHGLLLVNGLKVVRVVPGQPPVTLVDSGRPQAVASRWGLTGAAPVWVAFAGGTVRQLDGPSWTVGSDPRGLAYADDGDAARADSTLVVASRGNGTAALINVDTGALRSVAVSPTPSRVVTGTTLRSQATVPSASLVYTSTRSVLKTVSVLNQSPEALPIDSVGFVNSPRFSVAVDACAGKTLPVGGSCSVTVRFTANAMGPTFMGTLQVNAAWPNLPATGVILARYGVLSI